MVADFFCLQAPSAAASPAKRTGSSPAKPKTKRQVVGDEQDDGSWMATQEEEKGDAREDGDAQSSREASVDADDQKNGDDEEVDEEDDEEEEEDDEEEEEDDEADEDDGDEAEDGDEGEGGGDGGGPSVPMQGSEKRATTQSPPAKRRTRAAGAAAEAEVSLTHTASQPTLAAHGPQWAASCRSALALKRARKDQAKTWQEARKTRKPSPPRKAPAQPESLEPIPKKPRRANAT